jgi:hypothetical protein
MTANPSNAIKIEACANPLADRGEVILGEWSIETPLDNDA